MEGVLRIEELVQDVTLRNTDLNGRIRLVLNYSRLYKTPFGTYTN